MKKNKILLIAAVACTSMFSSCSDLLDLYPEDSLSFLNPEKNLILFTGCRLLSFYKRIFAGIKRERHAAN